MKFMKLAAIFTVTAIILAVLSVSLIVGLKTDGNIREGSADGDAFMNLSSGTTDIPADLEQAIVQDPNATAVGTASQFINMESGGSYYLTADIDLTGYGYGSGYNSPNCVFPEFSGKIDGRGHKITGLYLGNNKADDVGLIKRGADIGTLVVMNLKIENPVIKINNTANDGNTQYAKSFALLIGVSGSYKTYIYDVDVIGETIIRDTVSNVTCGHIGGLVGYINAITFYKCDVEVNITAGTNSSCNAGGFIGNARNTTIFIDCTSKGTIKAGYAGTQGVKYINTSGFIGASNTTGNNISFINCVNNTNTITYSTTTESRSAGFSGYGDSSYSFTDCENNGSITVMDTTSGKVADGRAAGFIATLSNSASTATFENCNNNGKISATKWAAGFFCETKSTNSTTFNNCNNYGEIKARDYAGGFMANNSSVCSISYSNNFVKVTGASTSSPFVAIGGCSLVESYDFDAIDCDFNAGTGTLTIRQTGKITKYPWPNATAVKKVVIESGATSIESKAFSALTAMTSITIPDSVVNIYSDAFEGTALYNNSANWTDNVLYIGTRLIKARAEITGVVTVKPGTVYIAVNAFSGCTGMTDITIPSSVEKIGSGAFKKCSGLTQAVIPDSVTEIGDFLFSDCTEMTDVTVGNGIRNLGSETFSGCERLVNINLKTGLTNIGEYAFAYCIGLENITLPNSVIELGESAFSGCSELTSFVFPDSVKIIGDNIFNECYELKEISIPSGVTSIGEYAFIWCMALEKITIPAQYIELVPKDVLTTAVIKGGTVVPADAFRDCTTLTGVTFGTGLTAINSGAFSGCTALDHVYYLGTQTQWNSITIASNNEPLTALTPVFIKEHYFISWSVNGTVTTEKYSYGELPSFKGETAKAGNERVSYEFTGWNNTVTAVNSDTTYVAQYREVVNEYDITWIVDGVESHTSVGYGVIPFFDGNTVKAPDAQYTYTFTEWSPAPTAATGAATYTALYDKTVNKYNVTWIVDGVQTVKSVEYNVIPTFGGTPVKAPDVQYTYTFEAWDKDVVAVTENVTYTAVFVSIVNKYPVKWVIDGTVVTEMVDYGTVPNYTTIITKDPDEQGTYLFSGWNPATVEVTGPATYTAVFGQTLIKYPVTWVVGDARTVEMVDYGTIPSFGGDTLKAPDAEYTYTFKGWDKTISAVTGAVTYTAQYSTTKNKYIITWVVDGNSTVALVEYGKIPEFTGNTAKAPDAHYTYAFSGWDKTPTSVTGAAAYTAQYGKTVNKYNITWIVNDVPTVTQVEYGVTPAFAGETAKAPDVQYTYEFSGWDRNVVAVTEDMTYVARYSKKTTEYTIKWTVDGNVTEVSVGYGMFPEFDGYTDKEGDEQYTYTFVGWDNTPVVVTGNAEYTAVYNKSVNKYTITWSVNGTETTEQVEYGVIPHFAGDKNLPPDENTIFVFDGWDTELMEVSGDMMYTAKYRQLPRVYTVTWIVGDVITTSRVKYKVTPKFKGSTERDADDGYEYTFTGWDKEIKAITDDVTYVAQYNKTAVKKASCTTASICVTVSQIIAIVCGGTVFALVRKKHG